MFVIVCDCLVVFLDLCCLLHAFAIVSEESGDKDFVQMLKTFQSFQSVQNVQNVQRSGKIARISNHVYYHEKSALREAIRRNGIRKFISKYDIDKELKALDKKKIIKIKITQKKLENTFKCFSLIRVVW